MTDHHPLGSDAKNALHSARRLASAHMSLVEERAHLDVARENTSRRIGTAREFESRLSLAHAVDADDDAKAAEIDACRLDVEIAWHNVLTAAHVERQARFRVRRAEDEYDYAQSKSESMYLRLRRAEAEHPAAEQHETPDD